MEPGVEAHQTHHTEVRKTLSQLLPHSLGLSLQENRYPEGRRKDSAKVGCPEPGGVAGFISVDVGRFRITSLLQ